MRLYLRLIEFDFRFVPFRFDSPPARTLYVGLGKKPYRKTERFHNHEKRPYRLLILPDIWE